MLVGYEINDYLQIFKKSMEFVSIEYIGYAAFCTIFICAFV